METRRFHKDSRTRENFTKEGLTSLTGQSSRRWGRYVVKELVDNALEAVEGTADPSITVRLWGEKLYVQAVEVEDNGPGIGEEMLRQIADPEAFGGTKRHYALPTRGTQGNALMTIIGIQHLADGGGPLPIRTRSVEYTLSVQESTLQGVPSVQLRKEGATSVEGTAVRVEFGSKAGRWARGDRITNMLYGFGALNPHVRLVVETRDPEGERDPHRTTFEASADSPTRYDPKGNATSGRATWYAPQAFAERLKADIRAAPSLAMEQFVSEFDGLSSRAKQSAVLEKIDAHPGASIEEVFGENGTFDRDTAEAMREAMQAETQIRSAGGLPNTLGSVGKALQGGARSYLENRHEADLSNLVEQLQAEGASVEDWTDLALYYRDSGAKEAEAARTPFVFELAAIPYSDVATSYEGDTTHLFGINGSVAYSAPTIRLEVKHHSKEPMRHRTIQGAFDGLKHRFVVVTNLTCPNISFEDKGKQQFDTGPFEGVISDVVGKAVRKYERDLRPKLNELESDPEPTEPPTLEGKAPKGFIKDAVFDLFPEVYRDATEGGGFTITMRQLFYRMRPAFQRLAERRGYRWTCSSTYHDQNELALEYGTFTGYVDEYEQDVLGERVVYRKERGFFVEPHSNRRVELSTRKVKQYDPAPAVRKECSTVLYVEKTGFYQQLHKDFQITKRFDVGLLCAEGFATGAARDLVEKLQAAAPGPEAVRLLILTDLDIGGLGIAKDAKRPDALSELDTFEAERIGVELEDVEHYGLSPESAPPNERDKTKLRNRHEEGAVRTDTFEFLMEGGGQRVEINAFAPTELKGYVEDKLKAAGVEKIVPDPEEVETPDVDGWETIRREAVREAIGRYVQEQIGGDLIERLIQECGDEAQISSEEERPVADAGAEEVQERIRQKLEERPPKPWTEINEDVVDELTEEVDAAQSEFEDVVADAILSRLFETDLVTLGSS
jgi:hypothetical protein